MKSFKSFIVESAEQIDELSNALKKRYVDKAEPSYYKHLRAAAQASKEHSFTGGKQALAAKKKHSRIADKRAEYLDKAEHDLIRRESAEQIDELSRDTLSSYYKKSATQAGPLSLKQAKADKQKTARIRSGKTLKGYEPKDKLSDSEAHTYKKRRTGMTRAMNRINKADGI